VDEELETFEVHASGGTISPSSENEGTNAVRFAMMASLLQADAEFAESSRRLISSEDLAAVGINPDVASGSSYMAPLEREYREAEFINENFRRDSGVTDIRFKAFLDLSEGAKIEARLALLAAGLCSSLERESATSASAILASVSANHSPSSVSGWRGWPHRFVDRTIDSMRIGGFVSELVAAPDEDGDPAEPLQWDAAAWQKYSAFWLRDLLRRDDPSDLLAGLRFLAQIRVELGRRSIDPIVRELSFASFLNRKSTGSVSPSEPSKGAGTARTDQASTMVHGTWGWKGNWWYPGGDFHSFIAAGVRPALYSSGQEFAWSGAYSDKQRAVAGDRFARWAASTGGANGLGTVFAHSYGAEVVARAVNSGIQIGEVVLLSAPINSHHMQMLGSVGRVVDVRLKFDIVLLAARATRLLPNSSNVTSHVLNSNHWSHSATHNPVIWANEGIAAAVDL
jgi:hypothetical protein